MKRTQEYTKDASDIKQDFPGAQTHTYGRPNCFTCEATLPDGDALKGLGTTFESAEDTAWHAVRLTLKAQNYAQA